MKIKQNLLIKCTFLWFLTVGLVPFAHAQKTPSEIYRNTSPAVVLLISRNPESRTRSIGTGFIIKQGLILTNSHVVCDDNNRPLRRVTVFLQSENPNDDNRNKLKGGHAARLLYHDTDLDLALLKAKTLPDSQSIPFGNSEKALIGDPVLVIGHPEKGGLWSLTSGRIGSKIKNFRKIPGKHIFQAEASINHGNSGGPMLNMEGHMIGVVSSMYRTASDGSAITGINFALQSKVVQKWLKLNRVSVAIEPTSIEKSRKVVSAKKKPSSPEDQDQNISNQSSSTVASSGANKTKEKQSQKLSPPVQNVLPPPGSPSKLLTKPRPYKDEDLFSQLEKKMKKDFDQMEEQMEKEFDQMKKKMEKDFNSE